MFRVVHGAFHQHSTRIIILLCFIVETESDVKILLSYPGVIFRQLLGYRHFPEYQQKSVHFLSSVSFVGWYNQIIDRGTTPHAIIIRFCNDTILVLASHSAQKWPHTRTLDDTIQSKTSISKDRLIQALTGDIARYVPEVPHSSILLVVLNLCPSYIPNYTKSAGEITLRVAHPTCTCVR